MESLRDGGHSDKRVAVTVVQLEILAGFKWYFDGLSHWRISTAPQRTLPSGVDVFLCGGVLGFHVSYCIYMACFYNFVFGISFETLYGKKIPLLLWVRGCLKKGGLLEKYQASITSTTVYLCRGKCRGSYGVFELSFGVALFTIGEFCICGTGFWTVCAFVFCNDHPTVTPATAINKPATN